MNAHRLFCGAAILICMASVPARSAVTVQAEYVLGIVPHLRISAGTAGILDPVAVTKSGNAEYTDEPYTIDADYFTTISNDDYADWSFAGVSIHGIAEFVNTTSRKVTAAISFTQSIRQISFVETDDPAWPKYPRSYFAFDTLGWLDIDYFPSDKESRFIQRVNYNSAPLPIVFASFNVNPGDTARVEFLATLVGYVHSSVPEPQSWMMLIAGFAMIGTVARQQAKNAA